MKKDFKIRIYICLLVLSIFTFLACQNGSTNFNDSNDGTTTSSISCYAGEDQTVTELGATVTLKATVSNAASDNITYLWTSSDENIILSNSDTATASFELTLDMYDSDYYFTVSVDDGTNTASDGINVTVNYINEIIADDYDSGDFFGQSISLSSDGSTALIGATYADSDEVSNTGAAYIFTRNGSTWSQKAKLTASDGAEYDFLGQSVSLSSDGSTALVGAYQDDSAKGSAYIFTKAGGDWADCNETAKLTASDGETYEYFGFSVSLSSDGSTALIGAWGDYISGIGTNVGGAYIFKSSSWSNCNETAKLVASVRERSDCFGYSVSLSADGTTALVGAYCFDVDDVATGAAFIFVSDDWANCTETAILTAYDGVGLDTVGYKVSLSADGTTALVISCDSGDYNSDDIDDGAAYIFKKDGSWNDCNETAKLTLSSTESSYKYFGCSACISGDGTKALIGSSGNAYFFTTNSWSDCNETYKIYCRNSYSLSISSDGSCAMFGGHYGISVIGKVYSIIF